MLLHIKSAFLQNKNIDRAVYVKPPNEADCQAKPDCRLSPKIWSIFRKITKYSQN